jgi:hypothetical protein
MISASSFPAVIILRSAEAVIEPSGNASIAAISNRNGVVGVTTSAAGILTAIICAVQIFLGGVESSAPPAKLTFS